MLHRSQCSFHAAALSKMIENGVTQQFGACGTLDKGRGRRSRANHISPQVKAREIGELQNGTVASTLRITSKDMRGFGMLVSRAGGSLLQIVRA